MISTLIALPYELARLPLTTVDQRLSRRLPETSLPRTILDRAIGSADKLAGALLRNDQIASRGADRIAHSDKLVKAARLEDQADDHREAARDAAETGRQEAAQKREAAAVERASSGLTEAKKAEAQGKQQATANAEKAAAAKTETADKKAAKRTATVEQRKKRVDAAAEVKKKAARAEAKAGLDDARKSQEAAAEALADAEVLSNLTEAKKEERKQDTVHLHD